MEFTHLPLQTRIKINQLPFHNNKKKQLIGKDLNAKNVHDSPSARMLVIKL